MKELPGVQGQPTCFWLSQNNNNDNNDGYNGWVQMCLTNETIVGHNDDESKVHKVYNLMNIPVDF